MPAGLVTSATKKTKEICSPSLNGPPIQRMCDYSEVLFEAPYGLDKLDGTNYAGLTKEGLAFNVSLRYCNHVLCLLWFLLTDEIVGYQLCTCRGQAPSPRSMTLGEVMLIHWLTHSLPLAQWVRNDHKNGEYSSKDIPFQKPLMLR